MNLLNHMPEPRSIAVRGYTIASEGNRGQAPPRQTPAAVPSKWVLIFDTETHTDAAQHLRFGSFQVRKGEELREAGLFYDPESLSGQELELLEHYAASHGYALYPVADFMEEIFFKIGYELRATIVGLNLPFDISRLAIGHQPARGKTMRGGFSFKLSLRWYRPRVQVKHLSQRVALIQFTMPAQQQYSRGQRRRHIMVPIQRGFFVDVKTLAAALTSQSHSLDSLGKLLRIAHPKQTAEEHGGLLSESYLDYAMRDVQATWECFVILRERYLHHGLSETPVHRIYSEAGLGKAYLKAMGIHPWRSLQPDFSPELLGVIMSTYYGGRSEVHWRREVVQALYCDFLSMYPTVCTLMGLWRYVIAQGMDWADATDWTRDCLEHIEIEHLQDADFWTALPVLVQVLPEGDIFPVRAKYGGDAQYTTGLNHLSSDTPLWYTLADCMASRLLTDKPPHILKALRFTPKEMQQGLMPVSIAGKSHYRVDPASDDFYRRLIDLRRSVKDRAKNAAGSEAEALDSEQLALKILANATSYGIFVELNAEEQDEPITVTCYGPNGTGFPVSVHQVEETGKYFHPLLATLITGAARLMLAITERLAMDAGIHWAFCDTDSMALAKPHDMAEADFRKKAEQVRQWFDPLNPYMVKGSILNMENANYQIKDGKITKILEPLYCWVVSAKRYALFNRDSIGRPILRKASAHGLGHLLLPYRDSMTGVPDPVVPLAEIGVERWQYDLWHQIVAAGIQGIPNQPQLAKLPGLDAPAASRYAATTPELLRWFKKHNCGRPYREQVRPFNFLLAFQGQRLVDIPCGADAYFPAISPKMSKTKLPHLPRAVAPYNREPQQAVPFCFDRNTGQRVTKNQLKTYRRALAQYHLHPEAKFLDADHTDRGLTQRRHIRVTAVTLIGKEANRWEEQFYLGMSPEAQNEYGMAADEQAQLMGHLHQVARTCGQRAMAKAAKVSLRQLSAILQGKAIPKRETLVRLANAAQLLRVANSLGVVGIDPTSLDRFRGYYPF